MDKETIEHYGWIVVVLMVGLTMLLMSSPLSNHIYMSIRMSTVQQIIDNRDVNATNDTIITPVTYYNITYNLNGGTWEGAHINQYIGGSETYLPTNVYKVGYEFAGWSCSDAGILKNQTTLSTSAGKNITLTANWIGAKYNICYNLNGGTFTNDASVPFSYRNGASVTLPTTLTRQGYTFQGWYNETYTTKITKITGTGDQTVYAKWTKN